MADYRTTKEFTVFLEFIGTKEDFVLIDEFYVNSEKQWIQSGVGLILPLTILEKIRDLEKRQKINFGMSYDVDKESLKVIASIDILYSFLLEEIPEIKEHLKTVENKYYYAKFHLVPRKIKHVELGEIYDVFITFPIFVKDDIKEEYNEVLENLNEAQELLKHSVVETNKLYSAYDKSRQKQREIQERITSLSDKFEMFNTVDLESIFPVEFYEEKIEELAEAGFIDAGGKIINPNEDDEDDE